MNARFLRAGQSFAVALALAISSAAFAQTTPGTGTTAQPTSPPGTQPASPPDAPATPQPAYPSSEPPRGTTPQQRQQTQQQSGDSARCNQQDELARSECLRRDMTDDDDLPAGATRSMQQRKQEQAEQQAQESMNVASEADTGSDQAGSRSRTRTAASPVPGSREQRAVQEEQSEDDTQAQQPATDANNASDTLGPER